MSVAALEDSLLQKQLIRNSGVTGYTKAAFLISLLSGTSSVSNYTLHFRTLAAAIGWNETALLGSYRQGLNPDISAAMALYDDSIGLESFLQRTTRVSQRLAACQPSVTAPQLASVAASSPVPEPMQIDAPTLNPPATSSRQAMEEHIAEAQGFIQPSTLPAASSFFFVGKKDEGLRPCIDYRQLNSQIRQQPYPLPLVPATLEELRGAQVFTKLDLRSAYNLVRICVGDEWKTAFVTPTGHYKYRVMPYGLSISPSVFQTFMNEVFWEFLHRFVVNLAEHRQHIQQVLQYSSWVTLSGGHAGAVSAIQEWPQSLTVKELQRFLGFSNFYRCFIQNYSSITAPLTSLLRGKLRTSMPPAMAPSIHPDPKLPFTVFHHWAEQNSISVMWAAEQKRATRHQASPGRVATLVGGISASVYHHHRSQKFPVPQRSKFSSDSPSEPEPIIPSNLIIIPILWDQDETIRQATLQEPAPPECPEGRIFVPHSQRLSLLGAAHQSPGSGHPGSKRTLLLLQSHYWWPSMRRDTIRYVHNCSDCAMSTSPRQLPTGKLVLLPIPQRPWSHIGMDFVTDLPSSEGNTCILVLVDRFSKMCKCFPLKGLPTALETAEHLFQQVFRHFGLPEEIVSDRGLQFISHVWKAFFKLLCVSVNLSSGYHPQTNGQTERKIQELGRYLQAYCHEDQHSWSRFLPWAKARECGTQLITISSEQFDSTQGLRTPEEDMLPLTNLGIRSGSPPVTYVYVYPAAS
ncbi:Transposon Tf2-8 polyprotein [Labeo rohita]|uniref:Gypsy retrotransposon integrase-like protein 1 n=1 Tax=Labeo rohita TaxID=84645 RepID=A0ABQ8L3R5_LABRO|nr:Transposon Tf2-8 polyprotein [Labeo rohita]